MVINSNNKKSFNLQPIVFFGALSVIVFLMVVTLLFLENMEAAYIQVQGTLAVSAGWLYLLLVNIFLVFVVYLLFSRYGDIRLGGPEAKPEFGKWSWFSMLFSAGMGIGLVFYSVAEPMMHFNAPPLGQGRSIEAAKQAIVLTFYHWGFHPWAVYALMGLALAFFTFNKKRPMTVRSAFYPIFKEKINGPIGHTIDILAVLATLFGLATSLGLGVQQINAGFHHLVGLPQSRLVQVVLIIVITVLATISVVTGLKKGIRILSEFNLLLAGILLIFVFAMGPSLFLLNSFVQNVGQYLNRLIQLSTWSEAYVQTSWQSSWTIFYWAWWVAWSPFVGMFIAKISKGRTIREFLLGVLLIPPLVSFFWLNAFGGSAIYAELFQGVDITTAVNKDMALSLFAFLENYTWAGFSTFLAIFIVITFFVTSSDSGSLVIDTITCGGCSNPPVVQKIFWALMEGCVAAILLIGGGLKALQSATMTIGLPFAILLTLLCFSLIKGLKEELASINAGS